MDPHQPNCRQCAQFQTTWDSRAPNGCRKFGFKTRTLPSLEVLATTGERCIFFEPKQPAATAPRESCGYQAIPVVAEHSTMCFMA